MDSKWAVQKWSNVLVAYFLFEYHKRSIVTYRLVRRSELISIYGRILPLWHVIPATNGYAHSSFGGTGSPYSASTLHYLFCSANKTATRTQRPPSPRKRLSAGKSSQDKTMEHFWEMGKRVRYVVDSSLTKQLLTRTHTGPLVYLNLAGQDVVILNTRELANELLDRRSAIYSDRPKTVVMEYLGAPLTIFLTSYGRK